MAEAGMLLNEDGTFIRLEADNGNVLLEPDEFGRHTIHVKPEDHTASGNRMKIVPKDPDDTVKIVANFEDWLGSATISSVSWTLDAGITGANDSNTNTTATNYISSGVLDGEYFVKCTITTDDAVARIESRSFQIRVVRKF